MHGRTKQETKPSMKRRRTKRAPDAGDSAAISGSFLRLFIFLVGRLRRPRPSAVLRERKLLGAGFHHRFPCLDSMFEL